MTTLYVLCVLKCRVGHKAAWNCTILLQRFVLIVNKTVNLRICSLYLWQRKWWKLINALLERAHFTQTQTYARARIRIGIPIICFILGCVALPAHLNEISNLINGNFQ